MKFSVHRSESKGFSLIEMMVAMGILSVLLLLMTVLLDQIQRSWRYSESRISQFREARVAFDIMTKNIGQATLNTYYDLRDTDDDNFPDTYEKASELHFLVTKAKSVTSVRDMELTGHAIFFQAPLGFSTNFRNLENMFNGRGYFVAFGSDEEFRPRFVDSEPRFRFRLMEFRPPAESNQVFEDAIDEKEKDGEQAFKDWFRQAAGVGDGKFEDFLNPLAENIITLVISPRDTLSSGMTKEDTYSEIAPKYEYDSIEPEDPVFFHQVPPLVRVTMIAIDEASAVKLNPDSSRSSMPELVSEGLFTSTSSFESDLQEVVDGLNEKQISHKVFSSLIMMRSAKWSTEVPPDSSGTP